jgi:hypothetical protein
MPAGSSAENGSANDALPQGGGSWSRWGLLFLTSIILALAVTEVETYSQNTFLYHPGWVVSKAECARPPMTRGVEVVASRNALAGNRLNLHAWFGCNELFLNKAFQLQSLSFRFRLDRGGELNVLFNRDRDSMSGFRLVRQKKVRIAHFQAETSGRFRELTEVGEIRLTDGWHRALLQLQSGRGLFSIDGRPLAAPAAEPLAAQTVGFRNSCFGDEVAQPPLVQVDDVHVIDASNRTVVREGFRNTANYLRLLGAAFLLAFGVAGGICGRRRNAASTPFPAVIAVQLLLTALLAMYFAFDYGFWSRQYPYEMRTSRGCDASPRLALFERGRLAMARWLSAIDRAPTTLESRPKPVPAIFGARRFSHPRTLAVVGASSPGMLELLPRDLASFQQLAPTLKRSQARVVILMGTSQLWGSGARREEDTIAFRLERFLATHDAQHRYVVVNMSAAGSTADPLFSDYQERGTLLQPYLLVVVLSNNDDGSTDLFHDTLARLVSYNACRGVRTVLVTEPGQSTHLRAKHRDMRCIAATSGARLLDLAPYMRSMEGTGFLWWDAVHLTSYGQVLAAQFIGQGLVDHGLLASAAAPALPKPATACSRPD